MLAMCMMVVLVVVMAMVVAVVWGSVGMVIRGVGGDGGSDNVR